MNLVKGMDHVLGGALSRVSHRPPSTATAVNTLHVCALEIELPAKLTGNYKRDRFFGHIYRALHEHFPEDRGHQDITFLLHSHFSLCK